MKEFWNEKYAQAEYVYGTEPNEFFRQQIEKITPGRLLLPAEGEGRNAVFAATRGWKVTAFDFSEEGKKKAMDLAQEKNVEIDYQIVDYSQMSYPSDYFHVVALIYSHSPYWKNLYPRFMSYLKPGGTLIIEVFNKKQINNISGGPKVKEMLVSCRGLKGILKNMSNVKVWEEVIELNESQYHQGRADVTRCIAVR
jgi:2-polyprenyl-3-methyl-5-hydroxy-6-metoxy-1,4-benzoquinol methylase